MTGAGLIAAVVIGRNEGQRLERCLHSLLGRVATIIYVDSGSTDDSIATARDLGVRVVPLDTGRPFTAARARNAGMEALLNTVTPPDFVQFVDGDCEVRPDWVAVAHEFLATHPKAAVACGRRRERFPDASIYNRLIDDEWDTPIGEALACGGDALVRTSAFRAVGGFDPLLIAGEEPELCLRLRRAGWTIHRLDAEMTLHDADLHRLGQWWTRARRAGHAYGEGVWMHGAPPDRHKLRETISALVWGAALPAVALLGTFVSPWCLLLLLLWPAQVMRQRLRGTAWTPAFFHTLAKLPESQGILGFHLSRLGRKRARLIEYK